MADEGTSPSTTRRLEFGDVACAGELFGVHNRNLERVAGLTGVRIDSRGTTVTLSGADPSQTDKAAELLVQLYELVQRGRDISRTDIEQGWRVVRDHPETTIRSELSDTVYQVSPKKKIRPRSMTQRAYLETIRTTDLVFGIGPAGTGKTYLAVAMAVAALTERSVKRVVLTRPAVEAGEKLGFLPGDMVEKVNPYLRPLYDALHDMLDFGKVQEMLETGRIEIAPLAYMRGRTLNDAFIILDEAQNTTPEQMKMFLTRLGFNSKAVVTGDVTQVDLPGRTSSGLIHARDVLADVAGLDFVVFHHEDVIRHPLVGRIVNAYELHKETAE